ncbi:MAG: DUF4159 domain-containing protein [Tepidisphaerales bacterium]
MVDVRLANRLARTACAVVASLALASSTAESPATDEAEAQPPLTRRLPLPPPPPQATWAAVEGRAELVPHVEFAIQNAVRFLYSLQRPDGSFSAGRYSDQPGATALVVLALISSGEARTRPEIREAVEWLRTREITSTYSLSLRAAVLSQFGGASQDPLLQRDTQRLIAMMIDEGPFRGLYTYGPGRSEARPDLSNSQYGVLGVWYAAEAGIEVPRGYWQRVEEGWTRAQGADGGFPYLPSDPRSYGSMTAAGIASLVITHDFLHAATAGGPQGRAQARQSRSAAAAERAVAWLDTHFRADGNPGLDPPGPAQGREDGSPLDLTRLRPGYHLHYLFFGYERVGEATGLTRFAGRRWYDDAARYLLATQAPDGSWPRGSADPAIDTAFAVLFLSRGRAPVVLQKLRFDGNWNNRTRDAASIVRWLRRETERHVNWQLASLDQPFDDLRESPILYIASDSRLTLPESQWHLLKRYIDEGGILLIADESGRPGGGPLTRSVVNLLHRFYPNYSFEDVPEGHPLRAGNFRTDGLDVPVKVLSNGIRELAVLLPEGDFPWRWQRTLGSATGNSPDFSLVGNLLVRVTGRANLRDRGVYHFLPPPPSPPTPGGGPGLRLPPQRPPHPRSAWAVQRVMYRGDWCPEPLAWEHLANRLRAQRTAELTVHTVSAAEGSFSVERSPIAHLTAARVPELTPAEREGLARYLREGGRLLIDAAGGNLDVALWAEQLATSLLPGGMWRPLPPDHPAYADLNAAGGRAVFRPAAAERVGGRQGPPRLTGYSLAGEVRVVLSSEDLTAGLVGYPHDGVIGYSPETARQLVTGLLRWAHTTPPSRWTTAP